MNNFSKFLLGLFLAALTVGGSAFKYAENAKAARAAGDIYGNKPDDNSYQRLTEGYNPDLCEGESPNPCRYTVTTEGASHVTAASYTVSELEAFANMSTPWVIRSTERGQYFGN